MNNEFIKGVLDAKISRLLTESDFNTFTNLSEREKLSFFINHELVTTSIVTNFEALCKHARNDLKDEIKNYIDPAGLYVKYFFLSDYVKRAKGSRTVLLNEIYTEVNKTGDVWLKYFMDHAHSAQMITILLRAKRRGDRVEAMLNNYLMQSVISEEVFASLVTNDFVFSANYVKSIFGIDLEADDSLEDVEAKFDAYVLSKTKDLAIESELLPTIIYYIKMKEYEILRLRDIYYAKRSA